MMERNYDRRKKKAILDFVRRVFRVQDDDMSQSVKEEWRMRAIPIEEAANEVWTRHAKEEWMERGMEAEKVEIARSMRAEGLSLDIIKRCTGLPESEILGL
jgi:predicted transposase YdaD